MNRYPRRFERDRPRVALDDDGVEGKAVSREGLSTTVSPVGNFEDVAADAERGAVAREEEGAHVLQLRV